MKLTLLSISFFALAFGIKAQSPCASGRYAGDVFSNVTLTSDIAYGANTTVGNSTQTLTLDFYEPMGDVLQNRPLIILAHGGSYVGGSKTDADMVALSQAFSKKGYVCASINYRLGFYPFDSVNAVRAVLRSVQDMKAAIRFFYKDKLTSNTYKVDTNNIFVGGSSAGAITALHVAYLNKSCEIIPYIGASSYNTLGGIEGFSGNQCYSSKINGVINICGALGKYGWLEAGDLPFVSLHGTNDATVKYSQGKAAPSNVPLLYLDGSRMLYQQSLALGISNPFYTWYGAGHVPYGTNALYMDSTINFIRDYLLTRIGCTNPPLLNPNTPFGTATLYPYQACTSNTGPSCMALGNTSFTKNELVESVYPNPTNNELTIKFNYPNKLHTLEIMDVSGKLIFKTQTQLASYTFYKNNLSAGMYFLKVSTDNNYSSTYKLIFN